jgi:FtsP/CotA-like multicopper oxidase with cupredoxin domain
MNRRSFLASTGSMLADRMLPQASGAWAAGKPAAVDFVADNPGDTLLHCHQALHMDFGFMQLMKYVG